MVAHRARALTLAVVAVALLVAIASWKVYQGPEALAAKDPVAVEYKCHEIPQGPALGEEVTLTDQFGTEVVTVQQPLYLCAPATKVFGGVTFVPPTPPPPHLKCYKIVPSGPPPTQPPPTVDLTDQFGTEEDVSVTASQLLCTQVVKED